MKRITFVDLTPQFIEKQYRSVARLLLEGRKASTGSESTGRERERDKGGGDMERRQREKERERIVKRVERRMSREGSASQAKGNATILRPVVYFNPTT